MFPRAIALTLIAGVFACPLWCVSGACCAQCSANESAAQDVAAEVTCRTADARSCCCHSHGLGEKRDPPVSPAPAKSPSRQECQGVCGGAVFEKPVPLTSGADLLRIVLVDVERTASAKLPQVDSHDVDHWLHCHENWGRSLRTLHASLLC